MNVRQLSHVARDWLRLVRKSARRTMGIDRAAAAIDKSRWANLIAAVATVRGRRARLLRHGLGRLRRAQPNPPTLCEIKSVDEFESGYARLAAALGRSAKTASADELEFLASIEKRRRYYKGAIAPADVRFLSAFVGILAPRRVVEIGTLTGFSAGIIASALPPRCGGDSAVRVDTIDIRAECAIDSSRPTGFELSEFFPAVAKFVRVHAPADSTLVAELVGRDELEVAFIDADHRHPLPLLDLLRVAPYMQPTGWILLHDIQLGTLTREALAAGRRPPFEPVYGAEWLFNEWPFRKISGGNIGAIQVPDDRAALVPFTLRMMSIGFETAPKQMRVLRRALFHSLAQLC